MVSIIPSMAKRLLYPILSVLLLMFFASCEEIRNEPTEVSSLEGEWKVDEDSELFKSTEDTYHVNISLSPYDSTMIYISNFYHVGPESEIVGKVEGDRIELPSGQEMTVLESVYTILSGSGNIATDYQSISWSYEIDDGSGMVDHVTATYTRVTN